MADLNRWIGMGRLTADPELKQTPSGLSVTTFSMACNRVASQNGEQTADFINVVAWRQTAEFVAKFFKKGKMICVEGSLQTRSYTAQDGSKRNVTEIVADRVYFTGDKADSPTEQVTPPYNPYATPQFKNNSTPQFEQLPEEGDLPF